MLRVSGLKRMHLAKAATYRIPLSWPPTSPHHAEIGAGCQKRMLGRGLVAAHQDLMRGPARSDDASLRGKFTLSEEGPP